MTPFWSVFGHLFGMKVFFLSRRLAPFWGAKGGTVANAAQPWRLVLSTRVLNLSNTPSPHRGAGGLKTLRDTAAPLGF